MRSITTNWRIALLMICCFLLSGGSNPHRVAAKSRPVLTVGTDFAPPYYFVQPDGSIAGVAVDVFKRAASRLDFDLRFVHLVGRPDSFLLSDEVDFWPVLTITDERKSLFHMSEPWLFNTFCLLRRTVADAEPGPVLRIAHWTNAVNTANAHKFFPAAAHLPRSSREEVMEAVCRGDADGGLIEIRVLDSLLLKRPPACETSALVKQAVPGAAFPMGIAAVKSHAKEADRLFGEITRMSQSGELGKIFEAWSSVSANEANSIIAMNAAEQRTRFAYAGLLLLLISAGVAIAQFRRVRLAYDLARREFAERKRAEEAHRSADRTRNTVLEGAGEGICGLDAQGRTIFMNSTAARLLGLDSSQSDGYDFHALVHGVDFSGCRFSSCALDSVPHGNVGMQVQTGDFLRADLSRFPVEFVFSPLIENCAYTGAVVTFKDITARQQADLLDRDRNAVLEMLAQNEELERIFEAIALLVERQCPGHFCTVMTAREQRMELRAAPSLPPSLRSGLVNIQAGALSPSFDTAAPQSEPVIHANIAENPLWLACRDEVLRSGIASCWSFPILSGSADVLGTVALFGPKPDGPKATQEHLLQIACRLARLAIEQTRLSQQLHHQANHDSLTGFPNRHLFEQQLRQSLTTARECKSPCALFYIDLDRFKQINDTLSHHIGDLYLCQVATRLYCVLPDSATLARLGGDEFGVLVPLATPHAAEQIARELLDAMAQPFSIDGFTIFGTASVGIALSTPEIGAAELQSCADQAMYRAKSSGRNRFQFFSSDMSRSALAQRETEQLIREALEKNQFQLYYQPQCRADGELIGFEALIRLHHPERGLIPPLEFIAVAEDTGLIVPVGSWVLRETCRQIASWRAAGAPAVPVAINVSAAQLAQNDFASQVSATLQEFHLEPSAIEIELTESMIMANFEEALVQMTHLRHLGIKLAIDDFGTGYSSLSYLHRLPIQTIKIDQSFVRAMDAEVSTRPLVEAIVAAARSLGCNVIAEGVETDGQRRDLARMGCDHMQGYFFGRPQPAAQALNPFLLQLAS